MSKYFDEKGYFKADDIMTDDIPFSFILGGRGTGKTYSFGKWVCENCNPENKFMYMRRTGAEIKLVNAGSIYIEHSPRFEIKTKGVEIPQVVDKETGDIYGYHTALSEIHNIRGFLMLDVKYLIFDEFIAERGTVIRKFAGEQMLNAYETINRNREINGDKPLKCVFLSNFNTSESDIMQAFGFTDEIYKYCNSKPLGIYKDDLKELIMINESPISDKKKETVLYKVASSKEFKDMAINNSGFIERLPIRHYSRNVYEFIGRLGDLNINRMYSGFWYISGAYQENPPDVTKSDLLKYQNVYRASLYGNVYSDSNYATDLFYRYFE